MVVGEMILETDILVIGGGPGGYTAAVHASDLGKEVVLVESGLDLGGVCLTQGCIPSKTLIHAVGLAHHANEAKSMGLVHDGISFDVDKLRRHIKKTVKVLSSGVAALVENRDIERVHGHARFLDKHSVYVDGANTIVHFNHAVIATGSSINELPPGLVKKDEGTEKDAGIWSSAHALEIPEIPESLLVIGGGYIGLEIGQAYAGLGTRVTLVEFSPALLSGADQDLVRVVVKKCEKDFDAVHLNSKVAAIEPGNHGFRVTIEREEEPREIFQQNFSKVLAATGRHPNTVDLGLDTIGLARDDKGRIPTDDQCRTALSHIFAVGDVAKGPALAHKASREGKVAVEVICGRPSAFDNVTVPAVLFTRPEIAWTGLTEDDARSQGLEVNIGKFPLTALGRARSTGRTQGFVKVLAQVETNIILGVGIVGEHASELVAEATLAIEMGATLEDLMVTIHPHPTFSESIMEAAEMAAQGSVHMMKKGGG
jgi:dihydrolipoamide dehydrogenase